MCKRAFAIAFLFGLVTTFPAAATTATFNFDNDTAGTLTPFSDTNNGITATFSSPSDPGAFGIGVPATFKTLTGNTLFDAGPGGFQLNVTFSQPITSISFKFALESSSSASVITFLENTGTLISAAGIISAGFSYPEGFVGAGGPPAFTSGVFSSDAQNFALDDIVVTTDATPVPLPSTMLLFATGLGALGLLGWRRKRKAQAA